MTSKVETRHEEHAEQEVQEARLFESDRAAEMRDRWNGLQAKFVDDPPAAVREANKLVDDVIRDLNAVFADQRARLESHLAERKELTTEDLRVSLQRYRTFFDRLLSL